MAVKKLGTEFLVNTTIGFQQGSSDVAKLSDGGFVVTWDDSSARDEDDYNFHDIRAQVFSETGARISEEILVNEVTRDEQDHPSVIGLADGGFTVAFEDGSDATVGGTYVTIRTFDAAGGALTGDQRVGAGPGDYLTANPQLATLSSGKPLILYGEEDTAFGITYSPAGEGSVLFDVGQRVEGFEDRADTFVPQAVATLADDRFLHVYDGTRIDDTDGTTVLDGIIGQVRDGSGTRIGDPFQVSTGTGEGATSPSAATLADGRVVVTWSDNAAGTSDIYARVYDASGTPLAGPFLVNTTMAGEQVRPDIAALAGGGFVVTWTDGSGTGGDASGASIKAKVFSAALVGDAGEILVNTSTSGSQDDAHVAALDGDRFVVSWTDGAGIGGGDVRAQIFEVGGGGACPVISRAGTQDGSAATNDVLSGPAGANTFLVSSTASSGRDVIATFETRDVFATDHALRDSNGDGIIKFGAAGLRLDGGGDTVRFADLDPSEGLRFLGQACDGVFVYADATVRPDGAREGTLGNDVLTGTSKADVFFFDTALRLSLGDDRIDGFDAADLLVTTSRLADGNGDGIIGFGVDRVLDLPASTGRLVINGGAVNAVEYDGAVMRDGVEYFLYSQVGSPAGTADLLA